MFREWQEEEPLRVLVAAGARRERAMRMADSADLEVVAKAWEASEAVWLADSYRPDILVIDLSIPGMGGLSAIRMVKSNWPGIAILALGSSVDLEREAREAGADGFLVLSESESTVMQVVRDLGSRFRPGLDRRFPRRPELETAGEVRR